MSAYGYPYMLIINLTSPCKHSRISRRRTICSCYMMLTSAHSVEPSIPYSSTPQLQSTMVLRGFHPKSQKQSNQIWHQIWNQKGNFKFNWNYRYKGIKTCDVILMMAFISLMNKNKSTSAEDTTQREARMAALSVFAYFSVLSSKRATENVFWSSLYMWLSVLIYYNTSLVNFRVDPHAFSWLLPPCFLITFLRPVKAYLPGFSVWSSKRVIEELSSPSLHMGLSVLL